MRTSFRKITLGSILWIIIRLVFVGFLSIYIFIPYINSPSIIENLSNIGNILLGEGDFNSYKKSKNTKAEEHDFIQEPLIYAPLQPEQNTSPKEQSDIDRNRIANEQYQAQLTKYNKELERYNKEMDNFINEEHPDPVIRDIEKKLLQKDKLTQIDIENLEEQRQKRINQLMLERGNNIINGFNQNPNAPVRNPTQQNNTNKDQFISIIK